MSGRIWFTADLHFGHEKVAGIRGFDTPDLHDLFVNLNWDADEGDTVYVLGDISGGPSEERALNILATLPGTKHLIAGNHDSVSSIHRNGWKRYDRFREVFASVRDFARIRMNRETILLSHYPYAEHGDGANREGARYMEYRLPNVGRKLIHGHTHQTEPLTAPGQVCVSWDAWRGLAPAHEVEALLFGKEIG